MSVSTVTFLERKKVIQFFGVCLILAPFVNAYLVLYTKIQEYKLTWSEINLIHTIKSGIFDNYILSCISIIIGLVMLKGSPKVWRAALFFVGSHVIIQILNFKTGSKGNLLWWPFLLVNVSVFIFIADQLVWKIEGPRRRETSSAFSNQASHQVIELKTYKKIYLRQENQPPWAEIKKMSSEGFQAHSFNRLSETMLSQIKSKDICLKLTSDLTVRARFNNNPNNTSEKIYYYEFYQKNENHKQLINSWFKKISV